ncbi:MAG: TIGR03619 family F420-dependent LLM class oxidoreductase [Myxococcota bacterium]
MPVAADLESGFSDDPKDVALTIEQADASGLVGCSIDRPVKVLILPGGPSVPKLFDAGASGVSVAGTIGLAAQAALVEAARELLDKRTHGFWSKAVAQIGTTTRAVARRLSPAGGDSCRTRSGVPRLLSDSPQDRRSKESRMRFSMAESMCDIDHYLPLVQAADEVGFSTFALGDSILYPEVAQGDYPYTETGDRSFLDGAPFIDPFQLFAAMSVVTEKIEFQTGVLKLPIRDPVLTAKQVSSLHVFTNERFVFGVGLSPWPEDFQATNTEWDTRGPRMDEMLQIIKGLMSGDYFEWKSEYYEIPRIKLCPTPSKCPPIIIGGHSKPAYRRAARYADGFSFISLTEEDLVERLGYINDLREEYGRLDEPFSVYAGLAVAPSPDNIKRLEEIGVTDLSVGYRNPYEPDTMSLQAKLDWVRRFGDDVIAKL